MTNMTKEVFPVVERPVAPVTNDDLRRHMLRVYNYMAGGLAITGIVAYLAGTTPGFYESLFLTPLVWVVMFAPLAFVVVLSFSINRISGAAAQAIYWLFAAVMGLSLSTVFVYFTGASIARTFFLAAAMFGVMSLYGYTTKTDLTRFSSFLIIGLIGVVIAGIVNLVVGSDVLQFGISVVGIIVFLGLTAWDTQTIKEQYAANHDAETNRKLAVMGALSLYLSFLNIFQFLLSFTGARQQ